MQVCIGFFTELYADAQTQQLHPLLSMTSSFVSDTLMCNKDNLQHSFSDQGLLSRDAITETSANLNMRCSGVQHK